MNETKITLSGEGVDRTEYNNCCSPIIPGEITFLKFVGNSSNACIIIDTIEISIDKKLLISVLEFLKS